MSRKVPLQGSSRRVAPGARDIGEVDPNQEITITIYLRPNPNAPLLPQSGAVLDWGCQHGPDSCLLRSAFGDRFALFACDFVPADRYPSFYACADSSYTQLTETAALPYNAGTFDAVIGSGVLEHVAMDYESLREVHRILKPGGVFVITYLPNWLSANEWWRRVVRQRDFHRRLYGVLETRQLLKRAGFYPVGGRRQTFMWESALGRLGLGGVLARIPYRILPLHLFCSTLCFAARKVTGM